MRRHSVRIRLNDAELTLLDEAAAQAGLNRSGLVRALIAGGSDAGTATRREALALLATAARAGSAQAAIALERALRLVDEPGEPVPVRSGPPADRRLSAVVAIT